jgi:tRNA pseudouridine13 synthase
MTAATHAVAEAEAKLLADEGVTLDDFKRGGDETQGGRRPYRVRLGNPALEVEGEDLVLTFELPKGSYATEVLHELLKDG